LAYSIIFYCKTVLIYLTVFLRNVFLNSLPHNSREKERDAKLIIKMQGNSTYISDPSNPGSEPRKFAFDYSYWSHDNFKEEADGYLSPTDPSYADQVSIW